MSEIYEKYYSEIIDENGKIVKIETGYPDDFNFAYDVMDTLAVEMSDRTALVHKSAEGLERRFTFSDMKRLTDKTANALLDAGLKKGDSVMLLLKRRFEFWTSILAIHKIGAVAIPTSHMVSVDDIRERVIKADVKAVICANSEQICTKVSDAVAGRKVIKIKVGDPFIDFLDLNEMTEKASDKLERIKTKASDNMSMFFTSGTNGSPKAVIHDHSYPIAHIYTAKNWHGVKKGGLHLTVADSGWAKSSWGKLYGQWFMGCAIMVYDYEQFYAADMLKLLQDEKITSFCAPPTIYKYLVLEDFSSYDLFALECVTTAGEAMPAEVSEKFTKMTGLTVREGFGQTETALQICTAVDDTAVPGSIGKGSPLYNLDVVDVEGRSVGPDEEGEIVIRTEEGKRPIGVLKGYLDDDELYKELWYGGIYHTNDIATRDKNGNFFYIGRNDDVIKSSGYRIGPSEVEDILMKHPAVFECAVTAYPSKRRGYIVKATVVLNKGFSDDGKLATKLQEFVKQNAAIYKYPRMIVFADSIPHTVNGKINRAAIRAADRKALKEKESGRP
ncbi:MAG: AMP-binding protein [Lachnospiraceae bacterium]|nr:AMP-binding protein [Lachnospiraceae bacterium]